MTVTTRSDDSSKTGEQSRPRIIAIMGSGETSPTMIRPHRELLARLGSKAKAVIIDTPYGFQENSADLARRAVEYFRQSVGHDIEVAGLTRLKDAPENGVAIEQGLNRLRDADYLFAGPGSPTYALNQWFGTAVPDIVRAKIRQGGVVTFSSAAALTLGSYTVPVYEIYKVGLEPHWLQGLGVLDEIGLDVAVIPHFDNAEGGHHDTRFCYLGEKRLALMEQMLPGGAHVLGIDEHTGLILDLDDGSASVIGAGSVTVRLAQTAIVHPAGSTFPIDALRDPGSDGSFVSMTTRSATSRTATTPGVDQSDADEDLHLSLGDEIASAELRFDTALSSRDAGAAVRCVLELEEAIHRWSADTLQNDDMDRARAQLRSMVVRLGDAAVSGLVDPRSTLGPFVDALLTLRSAVRADKRYDLSDMIRDQLVDLGVDVRDTPNGSSWELGSS